MSGKHRLYSLRASSLLLRSSYGGKLAHVEIAADSCVTDEPRRSVRATKGQHTKTLDVLDQPAEVPKKRGKKATSKKSASQEVQSNADEEEEIIRCICGTTEQDDDSDESWIACENCNAWQHNVCMAVTTDQNILNDMEYYCEQCKPEDHTVLLASLARGDDPPLWQLRRDAHEQAQLEAQKAKKGKKGKTKRPSDQTPQNGKGKAKSQTPVATPDPKKEKKEIAGHAGNSKRKTMDGSQEESAKVNHSTSHLNYSILTGLHRPRSARLLLSRRQ
jgi:hypothetical protein